MRYGNDFSEGGEVMNTANSGKARNKTAIWTSLYAPILLVIAITVFIATVIYSSIPTLNVSASTSILVIRVLSEASTILLKTLVSVAFEYIQMDPGVALFWDESTCVLEFR